MLRALKILLVLILLLVAALVVLVLTFDPNQYKPQIIDAAARHNVSLKIDGDLGWQLWPRLAIQAEKVSVAAPQKPDAVIASIDSFALALQIKPLLNQNVVIDGIRLTGAKVNLRVDSAGKGNWQSLGQIASADATPQLRFAVARSTDHMGAKTVSERPPFDLEKNLQLDQLALVDSQLSYYTAEGLQLDLTELNAELSQLKLNGDAFPVNLSSQFNLVRPEAATLKGNTRATLDLKVPAKLDQIIIEKLKAPTQLVQGGSSAEVELELNSKILLGRASDSGLSYSGDLALAPTNLQKLMIALGTPLPPMADAEALHHVALSSPFQGTDKAITFEPLTLQVDSSAIKGKVAITDFAALALNIDVQGDSINLDHYLAPPEATAQGSSGKTKTAPRGANAAADDALPLETLRALNLNLLAGFNKLSVKGLDLTQVKARVAAKDGLINLSAFDALLHDGPLNASAVFDARPSVASLNFKATGSKMPLEKLLADFDVEQLVSGIGGVQVTGMASGRTSTALTESMKADIQLTSQQMLLHNMNLEKSLCELAMLAQRQEMPQIAWTDSTKLKTLTSSMQFANQKLTINSLNSGVESMVLAGLGMVDLNKGALDFKFNLRVDEAANKLLNCPIANKKLLNMDIPIRCKDSFAKLNARSCAPDMAVLEKLYGDEVKSKLNKELDKQLKDNPELNNLLKGLLGGNKKKTDDKN
ncbi:AsmA family protein [Simiduia curdlanivorans]|uniref:AsmA family protein n=1 Tax=Simiduia curdlanivorans TaxID=1492769 RepID=A0ABV8V0G0_9GAMM|nr:AsmA family protein [Simiduia curdlanivorans]MDN3637833.1 AsmA family protein [Simiduia curdlanivorans]